MTWLRMTIHQKMNITIKIYRLWRKLEASEDLCQSPKLLAFKDIGMFQQDLFTSTYKILVLSLTSLLNLNVWDIVMLDCVFIVLYDTKGWKTIQ